VKLHLLAVIEVSQTPAAIFRAKAPQKITNETLKNGGNKRLQHAGNYQSTRRHMPHLTIHICDSLNARISLCARNASMLSTTNDNVTSIRSRVIYYLKITLINDNLAQVHTIIHTLSASTRPYLTCYFWSRCWMKFT